MAEVKYEEALKRLERLVEELDGSGLSLDARLKKFEEGTKLARLLHQRLEQARKRVEMLVKTQIGEDALRPVDASEFDGGRSSDEHEDRTQD